MLLLQLTSLQQTTHSCYTVEKVTKIVTVYDWWSENNYKAYNL